MPLLDLPQRSQEWLAARQGRIGASLAAACLGLDPHVGPLSAFNQIMGLTKNGGNKHTRWGTDHEGHARVAYECESGNIATETGLWVHPEREWLAASPDGLVGDKGLVEIKCPSKVPDGIPMQHAIQMAIQMACTGREWCDYFVWCGDAIWLKRVECNQEWEVDLIERLAAWYEAHILTGNPPPRRRA